MSEERKFSVAEVRKTISTSLAAAFGFVIALLWNTVVTSGVKLAGVDTAAPANPSAWASYVVLAIVITVAMVLLIVLFGRWASK